MLFCVVFASIIAMSKQAEFKNDHVCIFVNIESSVYTYKLTNLDIDPIVGFEVKQHAGHGFKIPQGWQKEISSDTFKVWASMPHTAIDQNDTADFSFNISTKGAVLGRSQAKVLFKSGKIITFSDIWTPLPEPSSYVALVAGLILLILLLHTAILAGKRSLIGK